MQKCDQTRVVRFEAKRQSFLNFAYLFVLVLWFNNDFKFIFDLFVQLNTLLSECLIFSLICMKTLGFLLDNATCRSDQSKYFLRVLDLL